MRANLAVTIGFILFSTQIAVAREEAYCVTCVAPSQTYNCVVETPPAVRAAQSLQLYCVFQLARQGGHQSCSVKRNVSVCPGIQTILVYQGPTRPDPQHNDLETTAGSAQGHTAKSQPPANSTHNPTMMPERAGAIEQPDQDEEPKTLIEATEQAVKSSGDQLKKTTKTVTDATKDASEGVGNVAKKVGTAVTETTNKVTKSVTETTKKAGHAVGKAAKSAYDCVTSLFSDCD